MAISNLIKLSLISASLAALAGCSPQDKLLKGPSSGGGLTPAGAASNARGDSDKQMILLVDRAVEASHLVLAVLDASYAEQKKVVLSKENLPSGVAMKLMLSVEMDAGDKAIVQKQELLVSVEKAQDESIQAIYFNENDAAMRFENFKNKLNTKLNVSLKNISQKLSATKLADKTGYLVQVKSVDEINKEPGKSVATSKIRFELVEVEGAVRQFKIQKLKIQQTRVGQSSDDFELENLDSTLHLTLGEHCADIYGDLKLVSISKKKDGTPTYSRNLVMSEQAIEITSGANITSVKPAACGQRPIVDISKIL